MHLRAAATRGIHALHLAAGEDAHARLLLRRITAQREATAPELRQPAQSRRRAAPHHSGCGRVVLGWRGRLAGGGRARCEHALQKRPLRRVGVGAHSARTELVSRLPPPHRIPVEECVADGVVAHGPEDGVAPEAAQQVAAGSVSRACARCAIARRT